LPFYPALQIDHADQDLVLAIVDDFGPVAAEERGLSFMIYFQTAGHRDGAGAAVALAMPYATVIPREIDDEDWARRSQQNLAPIQVGSIIIAGPNAAAPAPGFPASALELPTPSPQSLVILIRPSMGFGTGHHATTRLCLAALQTLDLEQMSVLDVGTGSGVLAIAARRLGAAYALGIDSDPDAIQSARENLPLNPGADRVTFERYELGRDVLPKADLVLANLTGGLLCRSARALIDLVNLNGHLIVSGLMKHERGEVVTALSDLELAWEAHEDEWVALRLKRRESGVSGERFDRPSATKKA
jgi:ribosomal protein L11 methyltransferase